MLIRWQASTAEPEWMYRGVRSARGFLVDEMTALSIALPDIRGWVKL
jgi:hypothetical protein